MDKVIYIIKTVSIVQVSLIVFFVCLLYLTRIYFVYAERRNAENKKLVESILGYHLEQAEPLCNSPERVKLLRNSISDVFSCLAELEINEKQSVYLPQFLKEVSDVILKPVARRQARSRKWFNRYIATLCFLYGFDEEDIPIISKLIGDDIVLVSVNAAKVSVKYDNPILINEMISFFSEGRRLQQSVYADLITKNNTQVGAIIEERLENEADIYTKIYCYRLLDKLVHTSRLIVKAREDLKIDSVDLRIAILNYISKIPDEAKNELIYGSAQDPNWEVRAVVAKLLGSVDSEKSLTLLEQMLKDPEWWLRINAANSLGKKGPKGIRILKAQSPEKDRFAYETATEVLRQLEKLG